MKTLKATTIILVVVCSQGFIPTGARAQQKSHLEVLEVKPDPVGRGRNVVNAKIRNTSSEDQALSLEIRTEGPGGNWQTQFPHVVPGGTTQWIRQAYIINGFVAEDLRIRMRFYATGPANGANIAQTSEHLKTVQYSTDKLEHAAPDESEPEPATGDQKATVTRILRQFQKLVQNEDYETAWQFFSQDFRDVEGFGKLSTFRKCMETPYLMFPLSRAEVLALEPKSAGRRRNAIDLSTVLQDEHWKVSFVKVEDGWRIDSFGRIDTTPKESIPLDPATQEQAVRKAFKKWQGALRNGELKTAWALLASSLRRSRQLGNDFQRFTKEWSSDENPMKTLFLDLRPESVTIIKMGESAILNARHAGQPWRILYVMEDGQWKFHIMKRGHQGEGDWRTRLLPKMQKRSTKHFDIYCFKGSTAERDIDKIAEHRDRGFSEICRFLGKDSDVRICMVLFEDGATKYSHTGHTGAGWATGNMIVEIYNEEQQLDPYHETAHILMRAYGSPPALFNEGFATYISERLGSHALAAMSGGESSIYERVRQLDGNGQLIPLEELLTYTEIGSGESNPPVAYPEAASFVKFLIDAYGKDKFLRAYKSLANSKIRSVHKQNVGKLEKIYGFSLADLKKQWMELLTTG